MILVVAILATAGFTALLVGAFGLFDFIKNFFDETYSLEDEFDTDPDDDGTPIESYDHLDEEAIAEFYDNSEEFGELEETVVSPTVEPINPAEIAVLPPVPTVNSLNS